MELKNNSLIYPLCIIIAATLWGIDGIFLTPNLYNLNVPFVVFILHFIPFIFLNPIMFRKYKVFFEFSNQDKTVMFLIALFGGALGTLAIVRALFLVNFDHLSIVILLQKLQPVFAIILASLVLKEKLTKRFILLASVAVVSSYFLTFGASIPNFVEGEKLIHACIWSLIAAFSFGISTVLGRKLVYRHPFPVIHFFRFGLTTFIMIPIVFLFGSFNGFIDASTKNWIVITIISITSGSGAVFLYYFGLTKVRAQVATLCELFFPITAILLDYFVNGHALSPVQLGAAFVMIGSVLSIAAKKR